MSIEKNSLISSVAQETLARLIKISTVINSSLNLTEVLENVMNITTELLDAEASSLMLMDETGENLIFQTTVGSKSDELKNFSLKKGQGIAGWVAEKGKPLLVPRVEDDPRHFHDADIKTGFSTESIICVPMKLKENILGVIEVINKKDGSEFSADDLPLLEAIASQSAIAIEHARLVEKLNMENVSLKKELETKHTLIWKSQIMQDVVDTALKAAKVDSTVLMRGKSGTGKEVVARMIHHNSPRKDNAFVSVTCSILSQSLLESELFGHEKGAFTGADKQKIGRFEMAQGGTIFLDEIGTLALETQLRLLRVLQEKEFERVGGEKTIQANVRIIAATNADLEKLIEEEKFREDLYYRLKVIEITMPDLREKPEDIAHLAEYFLEKNRTEIGRDIKGISPEAMKLIKEYSWPGNVRELKNVIERSVVLGTQDYIQPEDLPKEITDSKSSTLRAVSSPSSLKDVEKDLIIQTLHKYDWNKSKTAKILGFSRNRLDRKITEYHIKKDA